LEKSVKRTKRVFVWCFIVTWACFGVGVSETGQDIPHRGRNQESLTVLYVERSEDESEGKTQHRQLIAGKSQRVMDLLNTGQ